MRQAGLVVHADVTRSGESPPAVNIAGIRIVQEALANVLRHRGPGPAWLSVTERKDHLEVIVEDDGDQPPNTDASPQLGTGTGTGLLGMRERAEGCGGRLDIETSDVGGWRIRAVLPFASQR
jgi:signal transduction histidine kinase